MSRPSVHCLATTASIRLRLLETGLQIKGTIHGLINYKETKSKCNLYWCLLEFIDWRYSQSSCYFRPSFVIYCPSNLLSRSPPLYPPFPVFKYRYSYIHTVCGWGEGCWVVLETIFRRSLTLCIWPDSEPTKLLHQSPSQTKMDSKDDIKGLVYLQFLCPWLTVSPVYKLY